MKKKHRNNILGWLTSLASHNSRMMWDAATDGVLAIDPDTGEITFEGDDDEDEDIRRTIRSVFDKVSVRPYEGHYVEGFGREDVGDTFTVKLKLKPEFTRFECEFLGNIGPGGGPMMTKKKMVVSGEYNGTRIICHVYWG